MVERASEFIKSKIQGEYKIGIICGSGLGGLCNKVENPVFVNYADIPGFPVSTAPGHIGRFVFGTLSGKKVVCMQGRVHYYEGYSPESIITPIRVMKLLGVEKLIVTNAAGGINESFNVGDIMMITDHINFTGVNPLVGKNDGNFGVRFPDMSFAYSPKLRETAKKNLLRKSDLLFVRVFTSVVPVRLMKLLRKFVLSECLEQTQWVCQP